jgi:hypothetical protein
MSKQCAENLINLYIPVRLQLVVFDEITFKSSLHGCKTLIPVHTQTLGALCLGVATKSSIRSETKK